MDNKYIAVFVVLLFAIGFFFFKGDLFSIGFSENLNDSYQTWYIGTGDSYANGGYGRHSGVYSKLNYEGNPNSTFRLGDYKIEATTWERYKYNSDNMFGCARQTLKVTNPDGTIRIIKVIINHPVSYVCTSCAFTCPYGTTTDAANDIYFVNVSNHARTNHTVVISDNFKLGLGINANGASKFMIGAVWPDDYGGGWIYVTIYPIYNYINKITLSIPTGSALIFEGENKTLDVVLTNNFLNNIKGQVKATLFYDTPTGTQSTVIYSPKQSLALGSNPITLTLPTEASGSLTVQLQPIIYVQGATKLLRSGDNGFGTEMNSYLKAQNYTIVKLSYYSKVSAGKTIEMPIGDLPIVTKEYLINPQPIWLESTSGGCPIGYTFQTGSDLCIRDDILDNQLSCQQLSCPIINGHEYSCSSAGICVETVFVQKKCTADEDCPDLTKCDVSSGLCINEKIFKEILECDRASDCPNPCQGKSIICNQGRCEYEGECSVTTVGCVEFGCASPDFVCNEARNVCERTILKYEFLKFKFDTQMLLFILASMLIIGVSIYYFASKKK